MHRFLRFAAVAVILPVLLGACGQKGPLYLPSEDPAKKSEQESR